MLRKEHHHRCHCFDTHFRIACKSHQQKIFRGVFQSDVLPVTNPPISKLIFSYDQKCYFTEKWEQTTFYGDIYLQLLYDIKTKKQ